MTSFTKFASDFNLYFGELGIKLKEGVDKDTLEKLAKDAAKSYLMDATPLNSAIQKIAKENANLNNDHIRRISEMSNNAVYDHLFKNSTDKNVHFEVADPDSFLGKSSPIEKTASYDNSSYTVGPKKMASTEKLAFFTNAEVSEDQSSLMNFPFESHANPKHDLYDVQEKLRAVKEHFITEKFANNMRLKEKYAQLYKQVKDQIEQVGFQKVAQVMNHVSTDLSVLEDLTYDLLRQKVASFDDLNVNVTKVAELSINMEHPLVKSFREYVKLAQEKEQIEASLEEIENDLVESSKVLRSKI